MENMKPGMEVGKQELVELQRLRRRVAELEEERDLLDKHNQTLTEKLTTQDEEFQAVNEDLAMQLMKNRVANLEAINRLSLAAEYKDEDTGAHIERMSHYTAILAEAMGLSIEEVETLFYAAPMHDVGKIGIPDSILLKPGKLTDEEREVMHTHTEIGGRILGGSDSDLFQLAYIIAKFHHERWAGDGYPNGLKGEDIPLSAQIVNLADIFDALTSRRPYKDPYPPDVAVDIIKRESGKSLNPAVVEAFLSQLEEIMVICQMSTEVIDGEGIPFSWSDRDKADGTAKDIRGDLEDD